MFSVLPQAENFFDCSLHFNFLADLEILALEVFEIFQQKHPSIFLGNNLHNC